MPQEVPRLLFVHAHPDDETISNGATIAHYVARGAEVAVVTCTLGEEGEVIGERYARLAVDAADQLGGYRIGELTAALNALGVAEPIFLGGAGRWRDSGMPGTPKRRHQKFVDGDFDEAVGELVAIIRQRRPHVVVTYDPNGGYGHPDHVHTHRVTTAAVGAAGRDDARFDGTPWPVPKFYWAVTALSAMRSALAALTDIPDGWIRVDPGDLGLGYPDEQIDTVIDAPDQLAAKAEALIAHATQVTVAPDRRSCALSNNMVLPITAAEHYVLAAGRPGKRDSHSPETDLLAGLNIG
jgi:N-acetyl-1-D-myo-inositol-2-amino-2-deoxy-alpha-D-glucopyranoside deacetylase